MRCQKYNSKFDLFFDDMIYYLILIWKPKKIQISILALNWWVNWRDSHDVSELLVVVLELTFESDEDPDGSSDCEHRHFNPENACNVVVELKAFSSVIDSFIGGLIVKIEHKCPEEEANDVENHAQIVEPRCILDLITKKTIVWLSAT